MEDPEGEAAGRRCLTVEAEFEAEGGRKVTLTTELPAKVELTKGQKGGYGWTITFQAKSLGEALNGVRNADQMLRRWFLPEAAASEKEVQDGIRSEV